VIEDCSKPYGIWEVIDYWLAAKRVRLYDHTVIGLANA